MFECAKLKATLLAAAASVCLGASITYIHTFLVCIFLVFQFIFVFFFISCCFYMPFTVAIHRDGYPGNNMYNIMLPTNANKLCTVTCNKCNSQPARKTRQIVSVLIIPGLSRNPRQSRSRSRNRKLSQSCSRRRLCLCLCLRQSSIANCHPHRCLNLSRFVRCV